MIVLPGLLKWTVGFNPAKTIIAESHFSSKNWYQLIFVSSANKNNAHFVWPVVCNQAVIESDQKANCMKQKVTLKEFVVHIFQ